MCPPPEGEVVGVARHYEPRSPGQQQGKRKDAYDLLAPIYGWGPKGFDTTDLQEARALLDELGG